MRPPLAFVLIVVLLGVPVASATPFALDLQEARSATIEGAASAMTRDGALDLRPALAEGSPVAGRIDALAGDLITYRRAALDPAYSSTVGDPARSAVEIANASLERVECGAFECFVGVIASNGARLAASSDALAIEQLAQPHQYCAYVCTDRKNASFDETTRVFQPGSFTVATRAENGDGADARGDIILMIRDVQLVLRHADGTESRIDARDEVVGDGPARRPGTLAYATLHVHGTLGCRPCSVVLDAESLALRFDGAWSSPEATGDVRWGGSSRHFDHAPLRLHANADWAALPVTLGGPIEPQVLGTRSTGAMRGDASSISISGEAVPLPSGVPPAVLVATGVGAAVLLALLLPRVALGLYSRVRLDSVLQNPNRARILEHVGGSPGATAAEISRVLGLARAVSQHHLRMLESHKLVRTRRAGIELRYYLPAAFPSDATAARADALRSGTRARIAEVITAQPGVTQADICARTGLDQRLVSYHLRQLCRSRLVRSVGGNPQRYEPDATS